jgi:hypothetical protein
MNYFMIGGDKREYGPVDGELIRQWLREGRANGETLLRLEDETDFKPLRTFAEFAADFPPAQAQPEVAMGLLDATPPARVEVSISHAFARAWHLVGEHFVEVLGACLLVWMALTAMLFLPFIGPILAMVFHGLFYGGLFLFFLKLIREGDATPGDVFALPAGNSGALIATGIITIMVTEIATVCCFVLPGIYLQIAWLFALPLVADKGFNLWPALSVSRQVITRVWFKMFGLFLLSFLPVVVFHIYMNGRLAGDLWPYVEEMWSVARAAMDSGGHPNEAKVEAIMKEVQAVQAGYGSWALMRQGLLLISLPLGVGSLAYAYEDIFGPKK